MTAAVARRPGRCYPPMKEPNAVPLRPLGLVPLVLAVLLAFAHRPSAAVAQPAPPPELHWSACADVPDTECAFIEVPVDHARPGGPGVNIATTFGETRAFQH